MVWLMSPVYELRVWAGGDHSKLSSCVKVEVAVLDSPSLIVHTVSVDVKQH